MCSWAAVNCDSVCASCLFLSWYTVHNTVHAASYLSKVLRTTWYDVGASGSAPPLPVEVEAWTQHEASLPKMGICLYIGSTEEKSPFLLG